MGLLGLRFELPGKGPLMASDESSSRLINVSLLTPQRTPEMAQVSETVRRVKLSGSSGNPFHLHHPFWSFISCDIVVGAKVPFGELTNQLASQ